jgi:hypothetical protein
MKMARSFRAVPISAKAAEKVYGCADHAKWPTTRSKPIVD